MKSHVASKKGYVMLYGGIGIFVTAFCGLSLIFPDQIFDVFKPLELLDIFPARKLSSANVLCEWPSSQHFYSFTFEEDKKIRHPPIFLEEISNDPRILLLYNVLTEGECDYLIHRAQNRFSNSTVVEKEKKAVSSYRSSQTAYFSLPGDTKDARLQLIKRRFSIFAGYPDSHIEALQVVKYKVNQTYLAHYDWFDPSTPLGKNLLKEGKQRRATFFAYLNTVDPEAGGCTSFPNLKIKFRPLKGSALYWLNGWENEPQDLLMLHSGDVLHSGEKYGLNVWVRENPIPVPPAPSLKYNKKQKKKEKKAKKQQKNQKLHLEKLK